MSIYHFSVSTVSRGKSQSAVASIAYQSAEKIKDEKSGKTKSYTNKKEVKYTQILLPDNASEKWTTEHDQSKLRANIWNDVEKFEKRKDAVLARKIVIALPEELRGEGKNEYDKWKKLMGDYIQKTFVDEGMVADWALHDPKPKPGEPRNPHVHVQLTVRPLNKKGGFIKAKTKQVYKLDANGERIPVIDPETGKQKLGARNRKQWKRENVPVTDWDKKTTLKRWRKSWAEAANEYLQEVGAPKIDERSYKEQGKQALPTKHEGYYARKIEKERPGSSWKVARNQEVKAANQERHEAAEHQRVKIEIEQQIGRQKEVLEGTLNGIIEQLGQSDTRRESRSREEAPRRRIEPTERRKSVLVAAVGRVAGSLQNARKRAGRLRSAENGQGRSAAASEPTSTAIEAMESFKRKLEDYRRKLIDAWNRLKQRLDSFRERSRRVEQALAAVGAREPDLGSRSDERIRAAGERSPEAKRPEPVKKPLSVKYQKNHRFSLSGDIQPEKPEKSAFEQPVYGQSEPVAHTDQPKEPQNRHIEHENSENMSEEEIYAELARIFDESEETRRRKQELTLGEEEIARRDQELANTTDQSKEHELLQAKREAEQRKQEAEAREARSYYPGPSYHDDGPGLSL